MAGTLLTPVILRECTNDGKLASGAQLFFSESGNDIGKAVYSDLACTIPRTNPVICDASGWPGAIYGLGLYRIRVSDYRGGQIVPPVDGLGSGGGEDPSSSVGYTFVGTYNDIRALAGNVTVAYCTGRETAGDGGEGLFELVPGSTEIDDDGVILTNTSGSMVWRRITDGYMNPRWFGVVYDALVSQSGPMVVALRSSARHNLPLRLMGKIYITSNLTIPTGVTICGGGSFVSGNSIRVTFAAGSKILPDSTNIFGQNVTAQIDASAADEIKFTYFSDISDDDILSKFLGSVTSSDQTLILDRTINIASQNISTTHPLMFINNSIIVCTGIISGTMTISIPNIALPEVPYQIFNLDRTNVANYAFDFGDNYMMPDWFGTQTTDWVFEVKMASLSGKLEIPDGKTYPVMTSLGTFTNLSIHGKGTLNLYVALNVTGTLDIEYTTIQNNYNGLGSTRTINAEYTDNKLYVDHSFGAVKTGDMFQIYNGSTLVTTITATADSDGSYVAAGAITFYTANFNVVPGTFNTLNLSTNTSGVSFPAVKAGDTFGFRNLSTNYTITATSDSPVSAGPILNYTPSITQSIANYYPLYSYSQSTGLTLKYYKYADANSVYWTSPALLTGHSATISSKMNATASNIIGFNLYDRSENGAYANPFLYSPCLPQILSADFLATDASGYIIPGKSSNILVSGTDFTIDCTNMTTNVPARTDSIRLIALSKSVAVLQISLSWARTVSGSTTVPLTADDTYTCSINVNPISDALKYWINSNVILIGSTLLAVNAIQSDAIPYTHLECNIPYGLSGIFGDHANFALLGAKHTSVSNPRGLVQSLYGPTASTPAIWSSGLRWGDIFADAQVSTPSGVACTIEFSATVLKTA